jgi:succinyl-diaminopimelate desuccinylase
MGFDQQTLFQAVEAARDDLVHLTADLIRFRTLLGTGEDFRACCEYAAAALEAAGLKAEILEVPEAEVRAMEGDRTPYRVLGHMGPLAPRYNIVATRRGTGNGTSLHLNGHYDIQNAPVPWAHDPFIPRVEHGKVIGRGACDMKGGLAMIIGALGIVNRLGVPLEGDVSVTITVDTHVGGDLGAGWIVQRGLGRAERVIIADTSGVGRVITGYKGELWAQVETRGVKAHASSAFIGHSAVEDMADVIVELRTLQRRLAAATTAANVIPEAARHTLLALTNIAGGDTINNLAADCTLGIDCRLIQEHTPEEALAQIEAAVQAVATRVPELQAAVRPIYRIPAATTPDTDPLIQTLLRHIHEVTGGPGQTLVHPAWFDFRWFAKGWGVPVAVYGPGDGGAGTGFRKKIYYEPDEYVLIADLVNATKVLTACIVELTQGPQRQPPAA